jgi:cell division protein FtsW (lipid II flippase)
VLFPFRVILLLLAPLCALVVGAFVMRLNRVSAIIWGQQLVAGLILSVACVMIGLRQRPSKDGVSQAGTFISAVAALVMLIFTLLHPSVDGVRRWISLGPVQLHAGFVVLPVFIILAGAVARSERSRARDFIGMSIAIAAAVLAVQPDASQASAFTGGVMVVFLQRTRASRTEWIAAAACVGASIVAISRPDRLEAVPHVEGIVSLAASAGRVWVAAAMIALLLLPIPFVMDSLKHRDHHEGLGLAAYFVILCIAAFVAPFPVPLLGYGLSPILGYYVALGWIMRNAAFATRTTTLKARDSAHEV